MTDARAMTAPRRIIPGSSYVVARRCTQRRFYFTPRPELVQDFKYLIACAAQTFDIEIHALVFMSNHYHLWLTDTAGVLPKFMHTLNRNLAHVVKAHHPDIEGEVFDGQPYNALMVLSAEAATAELAYLLLNPVKAGLVAQHTQWPGLITTGKMLEDALTRGALEETVPRPTWGLRTLPETATFRITPYRPHALRGAEKRDEATRSMREILEGALAEVRTSEAALSDERAHTGRKVLGIARLARQSHLDGPYSGPHGQEKTPPGRAAPAAALAPSRFDTFRRITPALVARCTKIMKTAAKALKAWRSAYRQARDELKRKLKDVRMPAGTWWLKEQQIAACEPIAEGADPVALCLLLD